MPPPIGGGGRACPRIRPVEPSDIPEIVALCRQHAEYEGCAYREDGQAQRLAEAFFSPSPRIYGWVVEALDGACLRLDGYMTVTIEFATWSARPFLHMDCLYLRDAARGVGSGRALMDRLQSFAREHGIAQIQWQTPPDNALGIGFYERLGARARPKFRFVLNARESEPEQ